MRVALAATALALALGPAIPALAAARSRHFVLHVGQTRIFATARTEDRITCHASRHAVTVAVPPTHKGAFEQVAVTPTRRLAINVGRKAGGRVWALCRWR